MLVDQPAIAPSQYRETEYGYLEGTETPQGFCISRIHSTNLSMYLQPNYAPGNIFK